MIGIGEISHYVPPGRLSNRDRSKEFELTEDFIVGKLGVEQVSRKSADEETSTMCVNAFNALRQKTGIAATDLDCLVVCTQNPDGHGIPHTSAVVHGAIGAGDGCAAFDVSLGCSGYVYGLSIVTAFMAANRMQRGLLLTADPYSKILDPADRNTILLFGDAATATLLQADDESSGLWIPSPFRFGTRGAEGGALNNDSGRLQMNGRAVFNFSATEVPVQIRALLADCGLAVEDIDRFLLHQGSRYIVDAIAKRLQVPPEKVPTNLGPQGNTVSSSIPLLLEPLLGDRQLKRLVLSGFGVGLSWASCLLQRQPRPLS